MRCILTTLLVLAGGCADAPSRAFRDAQSAGASEAAADWAAGRARLLTAGKRIDWENLDPSTGLVFDAVAGCGVDDATSGRIDGYNRQTRELLARHGPPAESRSRHIGVLLHLVANYDVAAGRPCARDERIDIADAGRSLIWTTRERALGDGRTVTDIGLALGAADGSRRWLGFPGGLTPLGDRIELLPAPAGSRCAIVRYQTAFSGSTRRRYVVIDASDGRWLHVEDEPIPAAPAAAGVAPAQGR